MNSTAWKLSPTKQIGNLKFCMDKKEVRKVLGKDCRPFRKSIFAKSTTDAYADYHVYYTKEDKLDAIEIFSGVEVIIDGKKLFPGTITQAQKLFKDLEYESGSYISRDNSIGLYDPNGEGIIEAILVASPDYYR